MTLTLFDNQRKPEHSGFITFTFHGGIDIDDANDRGVQYLHIVHIYTLGFHQQGLLRVLAWLGLQIIVKLNSH